MAQQLLTDDHLKVRFHDCGLEIFGVLGDDFSSLWLQLGVSLLLGYILHLNFHGGIEVVLTSKQSVIKSGLMYRFDCISKFLDEEIQYEAILGPFDNKSMDMHISPLLVRDKRNSTSKKTIMDLSWQEEASFNNGVAKDIYLGAPYELSIC